MSFVAGITIGIVIGVLICVIFAFTSLLSWGYKSNEMEPYDDMGSIDDQK